jgi:hypothetical protein
VRAMVWWDWSPWQAFFPFRSPKRGKKENQAKLFPLAARTRDKEPPPSHRRSAATPHARRLFKTMDLESSLRSLKSAGALLEDARAGRGGWAYALTSKGVEIHFNTMKTQSGGTIKCTKGIAELPVSPAVAAELVRDFKHMRMWDKNFREGWVAEEHKGLEIKVTYQRYAAPWPTTGRDFCNLTRVVRNSTTDEVRIIALSTTHPKVPKNPSYVRGSILYAGWVFSPLREGKHCSAQYITCMDPCGALPLWVVNMVAQDTPMCLAGNSPLIFR